MINCYRIAMKTSPIMRKEMLIMDKKVVNVVKGVGLLLSFGGMILSSWVGTKENEQTLQKLVDERLSSTK